MLGNFDGVHLGHRRLAERALREGNAAGLKVGVWTFADHPKATLCPGECAYLTSIEEKNAIFSEMGFDYVIYEDFASVRDMLPRDFAESILADKLDCRVAVCGFNFRFGRGGEGTPSLLGEVFRARGRKAAVEDAVTVDGETVSSTGIRRAVEAGDMEKAARMLGRPYRLTSPVMPGKQLGRTLGLPTVNQFFPEDKVIPAKGIYACTCLVDGVEYRGVANVGSRPTVGGVGLNCETHLLGYDGQAYGKVVSTGFLKRLRDEKRFSGIEGLKSSIEGDIVAAKEYFSKK